ncbi:hypothetical protein A2630_02520 [Candidatus Woesebacteria bacterium RIFCSPHIGHO2_01_FULL_44_10]|uniref:Uncharacterized protein n=1 Tax=Candidatus Woesebacteria bacterium RIFCSPLOWO2_01_FULL_44_14 TaxID=1802525 RepID=A0A1F8C3Q1_9BACT|nr:MAG: hypothetical protein A2630_02520 [Candidatus Woesebacteria bacterium RIFCSPHIGHO2_01_FULL_44_10]OGM55648.1 MAG: hypothetical protein A3F62_02445 [Candidatus Woesebacteria bacterium RIFCSPHIGHO2_12_FULL_44_11]OGM70921.1 MAG: hypothetical protein A2975_01435 [Candidatus Woesebacteria bacterium RIFCSPLOWO2_01_FULL_44_14]
MGAERTTGSPEDVGPGKCVVYLTRIPPHIAELIGEKETDYYLNARDKGDTLVKAFVTLSLNGSTATIHKIHKMVAREGHELPSIFRKFVDDNSDNGYKLFLTNTDPSIMPLPESFWDKVGGFIKDVITNPPSFG